jgi:hypothetical protein
MTPELIACFALVFVGGFGAGLLVAICIDV